VKHNPLSRLNWISTRESFLTGPNFEGVGNNGGNGGCECKFGMVVAGLGTNIVLERFD